MTRTFVLGLASLAVLGLLALGGGFLFVINAQSQQRSVSYEEVSVSFVPGPPSSGENEIGRSHHASPAKIPENVLEEFATRKQVLNEWLDQMDRAEQKRFLENLSLIISKAQEAGVGRSKMAGVTERFKEIWDSKTALEKSKQIERWFLMASFASSAFGLLLILTVLSMVLVLLAIERNTRTRA